MFEQVDLSVYPISNPSLKKVVITIGDLHANALLLIYHLIRHGILNLSKKDYENIYVLYQKIGELQKKDKESFSQELREKYLLLLDKIHQIRLHQTKVKIRFLGDELADRGECDLFILKIFEKLHVHGIDFIILASNHGVAFLSSMQFLYQNKLESYGEMMLKPYVMPSFICLRKLLYHQFISMNELRDIIEKIYYPHLELIDYGITLYSKNFYIYTHAAMNQEQLIALAQEFQVEWSDQNIVQLAQTIEALKYKFKYHYLSELNHLFYLRAENKDPIHINKIIEIQLLASVFWKDLIWGRQYSQERPFLNFDYDVFNVHGHDNSFDSSNHYYVSLDNALGKYYLDIRGDYNVITRSEHQVKDYLANQKSLSPFLFFKPYLPFIKQSLLLITFGFLCQNQNSSSFIIPFLQEFLEQFNFINHIKLLKN
jgi:hypothetical protein